MVTHPHADVHGFQNATTKYISAFCHGLFDTSSLLSISIVSSPDRKSSIGQEAVFIADHESRTYVGGNIG